MTFWKKISQVHWWNYGIPTISPSNWRRHGQNGPQSSPKNPVVSFKRSVSRNFYIFFETRFRLGNRLQRIRDRRQARLCHRKIIPSANWKLVKKQTFLELSTRRRTQLFDEKLNWKQVEFKTSVQCFIQHKDRRFVEQQSFKDCLWYTSASSAIQSRIRLPGLDESYEERLWQWSMEKILVSFYWIWECQKP